VDFVSFFSAFGLGAIVTALVQAWLSQRADVAKRDFQEKKECYIGLLEAYRKASQENDKGKEFAYWAVRCALVAPENIRTTIEEIKTSSRGQQEQAFKHLQAQMRKDLGVAKSN